MLTRSRRRTSRWLRSPGPPWAPGQLRAECCLTRTPTRPGGRPRCSRRMRPGAMPCFFDARRQWQAPASGPQDSPVHSSVAHRPLGTTGPAWRLARSELIYLCSRASASNLAPRLAAKPWETYYARQIQRHLAIRQLTIGPRTHHALGRRASGHAADRVDRDRHRSCHIAGRRVVGGRFVTYVPINAFRPGHASGLRRLMITSMLRRARQAISSHTAWACSLRPGSRTAAPTWRSSCQTRSRCPAR